jgi:hypothetical protein
MNQIGVREAVAGRASTLISATGRLSFSTSSRECSQADFRASGSRGCLCPGVPHNLWTTPTLVELIGGER